MGSAENFEIIDATDHVNSGVQYNPAIFRYCAEPFQHQHAFLSPHRGPDKGKTENRYHLLADLESTKATSSHLDTCAQV